MKLINSAKWGEVYFAAKTRAQETLPLAMRDIAHKFSNRHHSKHGQWYRDTARERIASIRKYLEASYAREQ